MVARKKSRPGQGVSTLPRGTIRELVRKTVAEHFREPDVWMERYVRECFQHWGRERMEQYALLMSLFAFTSRNQQKKLFGTASRLMLERRLRKMLDRERFNPHYQQDFDELFQRVTQAWPTE